MKIIKPSVLFHGAVPTDYAGALKFIEMAGRTCYKSEDKITETSAEGFVKKLIKAGHLAMVEHSNFVVKRNIAEIPEDLLDTTDNMIGKYLNYVIKGSMIYIGGSLTAWVQRFEQDTWHNPFFEPFLEVYFETSGVFALLKAGHLGMWKPCPHDEIPKELHRYSAKFICDRGVSHELVRHRPCSFAQESTRYVSYGGKDMEFIEPWWWTQGPEMMFRGPFEAACLWGEDLYNAMLQHGHSPQAARAVLPNALKTEIMVTADAAEWAHIRKLRTHPSAHPDMVRVMNMMPWDFLEG